MSISQSRLNSATTIGVTLLACLIALAGGCDHGDKTAATTSNSPAVVRPVTLVISGDTAGWIVPCGCSLNQSGGLARRHSLVADLAKTCSVVPLDVGGAAHGTATYDRLKFEAILRGELAMGTAVHNLGGSEIQLGADYLRHLPDEMQQMFVSANTRDRLQSALAPPVRVLEIGGQRLAIVGVVGEEFGTTDIEVLPPKQAVLSALKSISGKYDRAIVLAYLREPGLRELAAALPEADIVAGGPTGQSIVPQTIGRVTIAAATNKGKFVVVLNLPSPGAAQICDGHLEELTDRWSDHPRQQENLKAFYEVLAQRQLTPGETSFVEPLPPNAPLGFRIAGVEKCQECHHADCRDTAENEKLAQDWAHSPHQRAWETLQQKGAEADAYCQQCHTTGYGLPGGFVNIAKTPALLSVGCESCHGPSLAHAERPQTKVTAYHGQARDRCVQCHDRENSPQFEYHRYWNSLVTGNSPVTAVGLSSSPAAEQK